MAKKDKSLLGSILKGTVDLTGEIIKTGYKTATSKTAKKFYKETADLTKDAVKGTYEAVTSESAKKIYKKTGEGVVNLFRFIPPKEKLTKEKLVHYLTVEEQHIKDTYKAFWQGHLKKNYDKKSYSKFKNHWRAICTQMIFGVLAKKSVDEYFDMKDYLEKELNKKDEEIIILVNTRYHPAYSGVGPDILSVLNYECFNNELSADALIELNSGLALINKMISEGLK